MNCQLRIVNYELELYIQTDSKATVIESPSGVEVHEVDRGVEHTQVLTLHINLGTIDAQGLAD